MRAKRAIGLAVAAQRRDPHNDRSHHVGYFLVSRGRFVLETELHYPARRRELSRLAFEALKDGHLTLDQQLQVSAHAANKAPSKLGLAPGESVLVRDLILGIVTKSANDAATALDTARRRGVTTVGGCACTPFVNRMMKLLVSGSIHNDVPVKPVCPYEPGGSAPRME